MSEVIYTMDDITLPENGQAWVTNGGVTSVRVDGVTTKSAKSFGSVDRAYEALEHWKSMGFKGNPSSPASFFRKKYEYCKRAGKIRVRSPFSANVQLSPGFRPLWIETRKRGAVYGEWYNYDLNRAFFWSGVSENMPELIEPYSHGSKKYIVRLRGIKSDVDMPEHMYRDGALFTHEDVEHYGVRGEVVGGVSLKGNTQELAEVFELLVNLPEWIYKRIQSSYWGVLAQESKVQALVIRNGEKRLVQEMGSRYLNLPWAALITQKVKRRIHAEMIKGGVLCYVDSVLIPTRLRESKEIGRFKLTGEYPQGVYIDAPGVWSDIRHAHRKRNTWAKHAGYA